MVLLKDLLLEAKSSNVNETYVARFKRLATLYGYGGPNDNMLDFVRLIKTDPERYKNLDLIRSKWRTPKSASDLLRSVRDVSILPSIMKGLGSDFNDLMVEHESFRSYVSMNLLTGKDVIKKQEYPEFQSINWNNSKKDIKREKHLRKILEKLEELEGSISIIRGFVEKYKK